MTIKRIWMLAAIMSLLAAPLAMAADSPSLTKPPKGDAWKPLFDGKTLAGWHTKVQPDAHSLMSWAAVNGVLVNVPPIGEDLHGIDLVSDVELGSHELYIEFMVPQGSNSGVYIIGQYEIQVYDSFENKTPTKIDCGGIYDKIAPSVFASLPPGYWQCFHAIFHKAVVKDGKVVQKPRITVYHNGKKVIDNAEIEGVTGAALKNEVVETGPTYLQGNHGMVLFRNIYYKPIE